MLISKILNRRQLSQGQSDMNEAINKVSALLVAMGGPDSTEAVPQYLFNIFSDRTLIRLPGGALFQKPFAHLISRLRSTKVKGHYNLIGGSSPLLKWTKAQADIIEEKLQPIFPDFKCYIGMRYYHPTIADTVAKMHSDGCEKIIVLPMYPQYSTATTGSSMEELGRTLNRFPKMSWTLIKDFHDNSGYIELMSQYVNQYTKPEDILLFSAHSLPQKFVDEGDPYVDQIYQTAKLVSSQREHFVSFQSRTGPVNWVGPDTIDETKRLLETTNRDICIIPISFVCDHIETLFEIDIELQELIGDSAKDRLYRLPMFNDDPKFGSTLAQLIRERIETHATI